MYYWKALSKIDEVVDAQIRAAGKAVNDSFALARVYARAEKKRLAAYEQFAALLSTDNADGSIAAAPSAADISSALELVLAEL
jgi:hypothetical protein